MALFGAVNFSFRHVLPKERKMKKITLFAATAFLAAATLSSCNDCITCVFADESIEDSELCGGSDLENDAFILGAELTAGLAGTTVSCE